MGLQDLLRDVTDAITRHNDPNQPEYPQGNLVGFVENLFSKHGDRNVRPASEDPYGDPGAGGGFNARPASQDPYGDPGAGSAGGAFGNVKPASEDPYGDPADR